MSNSSDKDKADWGNDTAPDAPYAVGNKKPPRAVQARFFWQSEGSPERKRLEGGSRDEAALSVVRGVRAPTGGYLTLRVAMSRSAYSAATAGDGFATPP